MLTGTPLRQAQKLGCDKDRPRFARREHVAMQAGPRAWLHCSYLSIRRCQAGLPEGYHLSLPHSSRTDSEHHRRYAR
jgi:hypothetical protein